MIQSLSGLRLGARHVKHSTAFTNLFARFIHFPLIKLFANPIEP